MNMITPVLCELLEYIRSMDDVPEQFVVSALTPIPKRGGEPLDAGGHRGLAVGGALAKCYAFILDQRRVTVSYGEQNGLRCEWQAGSRAGLSTCHNLYVLRCMKGQYERGLGKEPLYVCLVDLKKAFDKVHDKVHDKVTRPLLRARLEERGIHGAMLQALQDRFV